MNYLNLCIFGDESSQTNHRYLVLGTTVCRDEDCHSVEDAIREAVSEYSPHERRPSELKWEKITPHNLIIYRAVLQTCFKFMQDGILQFYGLIVDTRQIDNRTYNNGDTEIGFNKCFFSLLFKYARHYRRMNPRFYVYLDHRNTRHKLEPVRSMLNRRAARDCKFDYPPYRVLQFRKSHTEPLIQLSDIITGAVAYQMNGHDLKPNAAPHKIAAANFVAEMAGIRSLREATPFNGPPGFDLWHYDLSKSSRISSAVIRAK